VNKKSKKLVAQRRIVNKRNRPKAVITNPSVCRMIASYEVACDEQPRTFTNQDRLRASNMNPLEMIAEMFIGMITVQVFDLGSGVGEPTRDFDRIIEHDPNEGMKLLTKL
jgi:hypothetical protein